MKTYVATTNRGKLVEMNAIFAGTILELDTYAPYREVEETAPDYAGNALLKARALQGQLLKEGIKAAVLADDSGIECEALGGRPGVLSARYMPGLSWPERLDALLMEVGKHDVNRRGCAFVCAMALVLPDGTVVEGFGDVRGTLAYEPRGEHGFGYDPIFYYEPFGKTFGEIPEALKNQHSHRYNAAQSLLAALNAQQAV